MKAQRAGAKSTDPAATWIPPATVSKPSLLVDGADDRFREFIQNWNSLAMHQQRIREIIASMGGLTAPQYAILMNISHLQKETGVGLGVVAGALGVTSPFVVTEVKRLVGKGLIVKHKNAVDRRGVLLVLSQQGRSLLERIAPNLRMINDTAFGALNNKDFAMLSRLCALLVRDMESSLRVAEGLQREAKLD
jgi:DNA-binding MarR family transcriptional regulator